MRPLSFAVHAALTLSVGAAACGDDRPPAASDGPVEHPAAPESAAPPAVPYSGNPETRDRTPPWQGPRLASDEVAAAYRTQWSRAENRDVCAPLAPHPVEPAAATARPATFSGGWAVAYDLPDVRSAFGVAGTSVDVDDPSYDDWPARMAWSDGSTAGYGPEGGTGPKELAYLRIEGQSCLYNVWSLLGRDHLEALLARLRFVDLPGS